MLKSLQPFLVLPESVSWTLGARLHCSLCIPYGWRTVFRTVWLQYSCQPWLHRESDSVVLGGIGTWAKCTYGWV